MGFLKHLLFWPVTGPMYLAEFSMEKVQGVVKEQLTDDTQVKEALLDLQLRLELGDIDEEEYAEEETRLMRRFRDVRRWREEFGMATRGGVVRVSEEDEGQGAGGAEGEPPSEEERREPTVLTGDATLDISLDFGDEGWGDEEGWSSASSDDSDDDSSSS